MSLLQILLLVVGACGLASQFSAQATQISACFGEPLTLIAPGGFDTYVWTPSIGIGSAQGQNVSLIASESRTYTVSYSRQVGQNLITNPDFELGNTGFTSAYTYVPQGTFAQGSYAILSDSKQFNPNFSSCRDARGGSGLMLVADGSTRNGDKVWCQTVNVEAQTSYAFAAYLTALVQENPSRLAFTINDERLGLAEATSQTCQWNQFYSIWTSGAATSAEVCMANTVTSSNGNDFALDRISLTALEPLRQDSFNIKVSRPAAASIEVPLCTGNRYRENGLDLGPGETSVARLKTKAGCDSTLTVATILKDTILTTLRIDELCPGEGVDYGGLRILRDTTVCRKFIVRSGCDSLFCLTVKFLNATALNGRLKSPSCPGDTDGTIQVEVEAGRPPFTYRWEDGSTSSDRSNLSAGNYSLTVTDAQGCVATQSFELSDPEPIVINEILPIGVRCAGERNGLALVDASGGTGPLNYDAFQGSVRYSIDTLQQGVFRLRVSDSLGCFLEQPFIVDGPPAVTASLRGDTLVKLGLLAIYQAKFSGDSARAFWTYNGLPVDSLVTGKTLTWRPPSDGKLLIIVIDNNGCQAMASLNVVLQSIDTEFFPNAFSPNGDGRNDTFGPVPDPALESLELFQIFDRWGGLRYQVSNCKLAGRRGDCDWTGQVDVGDSGNLLDPGVYVYFAKIKLIDGQVIERTGEVYLMN